MKAPRMMANTLTIIFSGYRFLQAKIKQFKFSLFEGEIKWLSA